MTTWWHQERLRAVAGVLRDHEAAEVLDLGCGSGDFLIPLLDQPFIRGITGVEISAEALSRLRSRLDGHVRSGKVRVIEASATALPSLPPHDAAVLVEVIEHLHPRDLPALEPALFSTPLTIVTTPNAEFNPLLGVPRTRFRHPGHRFEWSRAQFRAWAEACAFRHQRKLEIRDIAGAHPDLGGATQMAVFVAQSQA